MNVAPLSCLTDAELQARIERFGALLLHAQERYEQRPFDPKTKTERDRLWLARRAALKARSRRTRQGAY